MRAWLAQAEIAPLVARALMEALPPYAIVLAVAAQGHGLARLGWGALFGLLLASALTARASHGLPLDVVPQRLLLLAASVFWMVVWLHWVIAPNASWAVRDLVTLLTTPWQLGLQISGGAVLLAWLTGMYMSVRGLFIGIRMPAGGDAGHWFSVGAISLVLLFALLARAGLGDAQLPSAELRNLTLGYFVLGLVVTAFDRRRSAFRSEGLRPTHALAFVWAVALPIACVLIGAVMLVGGVEAWRWLGATLAQVASAVAHGMWQVVLWLARAVHQLLQWLGELNGTPPRDGQSPTAPAGTSEGWSEPWIRRRSILLRVPTDALPVLLASAGVVMLGLFVAAFFRRGERKRSEQVQEESISLWSLALLGEQLRSLIQGWAAGLRTQRSALADRFRSQASVAGVDLPHDVRAIYRALLRWAADRGQPRAKACTPHEFAAQLARANLTRRPGIELLTAYYESERYGAKPTKPIQLQHAQHLFEQVTGGESQR